jgi:hypothetical protein
MIAVLQLATKRSKEREVNGQGWYTLPWILARGGA